MKIFDTHAHYDDEAFDKDRDELLTGLLAGNIGTIVNVGASMDGCRASVELASKYEHIYAAVGIHPDDYERLDKNQEFLDWLRNEALNNKKVVAIGEIGLDYYYDEHVLVILKFHYLYNIYLKVQLFLL